MSEWLRKGKGERNRVTQQVECFVPVGSEGLLDDSGLTEVRSVDCYDSERVWERENVTFDETVNGEYLMMGGNETKEEKCKRKNRNGPTSFIEWVGPVAVDELGEKESVLYGELREEEQLP